jgi:hypothetical protein
MRAILSVRDFPTGRVRRAASLHHALLTGENQGDLQAIGADVVQQFKP